MASGLSTYSGKPSAESPCHSSTTRRSTAAWMTRVRSGRRGIALSSRHEQVGWQLRAKLAAARRLDHALGDAGELVPHAAVVVVVGDLLRRAAPLCTAGAEVRELVQAVPRNQLLPQRLGELLLVVDLDLLLQVDHDQVGAPRALVVELALRIEPRCGFHPDHVHAGGEPFSEQ